MARLPYPEGRSSSLGLDLIPDWAYPTPEEHFKLVDIRDVGAYNTGAEVAMDIYARRFRKSLQGRFRRLNKRYWNGSLPRPVIQVISDPEHLTDEGLIKWTYSASGQQKPVGTAAWGQTELVEGRLVLSFPKRLSQEPAILPVVLLHEMVHMARPYASHRSPGWNREVRRISRLGALKDVI